MRIKLDLFIKELLLFGATLTIGIFSAYHYSLSPASIAIPEVKFGWGDAVFLAGVVMFILLTSRYKKFGRVSYRLFLILVVFSGTQIVMGSFLAQPVDLWAALLITSAFVFLRNVLSHNVGVILGIAGIGSVLGLAISPKTAVVLMVAMSFYDIIAVYVTKHMLRMAKDMMEAGATFGFIIPSRVSGFLYNKNLAQTEVGDRFMILGSGDIGLPVILASSVVRSSLSGGIVVAIFSLAGLFITHLIFVNQKERKPMAALPPIATMSVIGYLISLLF